MGDSGMRSNIAPPAAAAGGRTADLARPAQPGVARRHENRMLASLPASELAPLMRHLQVVALQPGAVLHHQDHPLDYVYFPHDGLVSLLATTPDGATIEAASVGRSGAVCPVHRSDVDDCFLTAVTQSAMRASRMPAAHLQTFQTECVTLDGALRAWREALLLQMRQNIVCGGLHAVEHRLSRWLLEAADRLESDVLPILATQEHVAQRLGVRRTTVTLVAGRLEAAGMIKCRRGHMQIISHEQLERGSCECYGHGRTYMATLSAVSHNAVAPLAPVAVG